MFALLAAACALPVQEELEPADKEALIAVLDMLRNVALATELESENVESQEREKAAFISVIDKLKAVVNDGGDWDTLDIEESEVAAFVTLADLIGEIAKALENFAGDEMPRAARCVRKVLSQY